MATKGKKSKLGHDPLSWISETDAAEIQQQNNHKEEQQEIVEEIEEVEAVEEIRSEIEIKETDFSESNDCAEQSDSKEIMMLDLPLYFGIAQVADVYIQMQEVLESDMTNIEIQAEDIESIDAAAIQLLVAFVNAAKSKGKKILWKGISDKLNDAVVVFQLNNQLEMAA